MNKQTCLISGEEFEISDLEIKLREKFGFTDLPKAIPWVRLRERGAFWNHWNLHNRKCDKTGQNIISVFSEKCSYPVWHKDKWLKENNPPSAGFDFSRGFFEQAWKLFQNCPIAHNVSAGCQNSEYCDDWWYSRNCYLCHSGVENEDLRYCYRTLNLKDCHYCVFTFKSELCVDLINCFRCFDVRYGLHCRDCNDSKFLYDCRNCSNCMFCFNLRNKEYCFGNKQLSKEEYEKKKCQWDLKSRETYNKAKKFFADMMHNLAYHRGFFIDKSESSTGNYLENCKGCEDCFFAGNFEDCVHCLRGDFSVKNCLDALGLFKSELLFSTSQVQDQCYDCKFSHNLGQCRFMTYCQYCFQCENCFGCCGLVGKKYCIFNKQYSPEEYEKIRGKIIEHMKKMGEWGKFFPGHFAPNPYDESWSSFYWPLDKDEQKKLGFRLSETSERKNNDYLSIKEIPDIVEGLTTEKEGWLIKQVFWDEECKKPFQILLADIEFSRKIGCPLPNGYYMRRIQENFSWMPFNGKLRVLNCGKCSKDIKTSWPIKYDKRILCEECYLNVLD